MHILFLAPPLSGFVRKYPETVCPNRVNGMKIAATNNIKHLQRIFTPPNQP